MDGHESRQVWTTASTVDEALQQLSMADAAPAAASRSSRLPLAGMALPVVSPKNVHIDDGGVMSDRRLAAPNVGALLAAAGAPLQQADKVVPDPSTPVTEGMTVVVTRIRMDKVTQRVPLPPPAQKIPDPTMNMSRQVVDDPGTPGDPGRHVRGVPRQRRGDRAAAGGQRGADAGARRGGAHRREARHRGAARGQRRDLGCPRRV